MSWQKRFRLRDDVGKAATPRRESGGLLGPVPLKRTAEAEVRGVLKGLARQHRMSVGEVASKLESGMWSRDHCLGSMRLQWAFEKLCEEGFETANASHADGHPRSSRGLASDHEDPRAA